MLARRVLLASLVLSLAGCKRSQGSDPPTTDAEPAEVEADHGEPNDELEAIEHDDAHYVGRELPAALLGELRDAEGRIIVLAPGFVAASACVDCGAPTYLMFLAVRCKGERECEVLTEACEGSIVSESLGEGSQFTLAFAPVEGTDTTVCAGYSGTFASAPE
ncbi:hypothetical protein ACNOYE_33665 [Nannocystaceae bacterium ST9]